MHAADTAVYPFHAIIHFRAVEVAVGGSGRAVQLLLLTADYC